MSWRELRLHLQLWMILLIVIVGDVMVYYTGVEIMGPWLGWLCMVIWTYHCLRVTFGKPRWLR